MKISLDPFPSSNFSTFVWRSFCHLVNNLSVNYFRAYISSHLNCESLGSRNDELRFYFISYSPPWDKDNGLSVESSWYKCEERDN